MSVRCDGDSRVMEQLGEKQDFECELSRLGFAHEDFVLHVRREGPSGDATIWDAAYTVCVTHPATRRQNIYWGGAGRRWLPKFVADINSGLYGEPRFGAAVRTPPRNSPPRFGAGPKSH
jgi:hypothetical protein